MHFLFFWGPLPFFCAFGGRVAPAYVKKGATFANFRYLDFVGHFSHLPCCLWGEAPPGDLPLLSFCTKPPACQGRAAGALVLALTGRGRSATAARRRRNTPGGPPAQGANAPERASRPGGARGAPGRASARAAHRHTAAPAAPRAAARAASHTKRGFCRTYLPYKIPAAFCMTVHFSRRDRRTGAGRRG